MSSSTEVSKEIQEYIASLGEPKKDEISLLHQWIINRFPAVDLWFSDGKNEDGKIVSNPSIGYGTYEITYANGSSKPFYRVGLSANTTGISVYIMGLEDKKFLEESYGKSLGKAKITGYCIKIKHLEDIKLEVLKQAIQNRLLDQ